MAVDAEHLAHEPQRGDRPARKAAPRQLADEHLRGRVDPLDRPPAGLVEPPVELRGPAVRPQEAVPVRLVPDAVAAHAPAEVRGGDAGEAREGPRPGRVEAPPVVEGRTAGRRAPEREL